MNISITSVGEHFVVSINGLWFPGTYRSEQAAKYAVYNLSDEEVEEIRETKLRDETNQCYLPIGIEHIKEYLASKQP